MTRSSRHKSRKQSKHSSRDDREYPDSEGDVRVKERNGKVEAAVRVSRDSEKGSKSNVSADCKSNPRRRHEGGSEKEDILNEKEEVKISKVDFKRKLEIQQLKESKDMETRRGSGEVKRRQGSESADFGEELQGKRVKNAGTLLQDELRNPESSKELEKRISERDKRQDDARKSDEKRSPRCGHTKNAKYRDERQKDGSDRYKYREDDRGCRHRNGKSREDADREKRHRDEKHRDGCASRDHSSDKYDSKHTRDENILNASESCRKKLRSQTSNHDGSPVYEDRRSRFKDDKEKRRFDNREDSSDLKSPSTKDQRYDSEKKSSPAKLGLDTDRGRSCSRHIDLDSGLSHSRCRSSPGSSSLISKDQYRLSKQTEVKYRHSGSEERAGSNAVSIKEVVSGALENDSVCRSIDKSLQKDDGYLGELSAERCPNSGPLASPIQWVERSPSSSLERRGANGVNVDNGDSRGRNSGFKDTRSHYGNEGKGGRDLNLPAHSGDEHSQVDGDNLPLSATYGRNYLPINSKSFLSPPSSRAVVDSPSIPGSLEDKNGDKSTNHGRDSNIGRTWHGAPNWPSPVSNGFIPFQHGPPPLSFHPMMQQFPASSMFGIQYSRELNHARVPYHIADSDRFSGQARPISHVWDANNGVISNDCHMYARLDWDRDRTMMGSQGWETSVDMRKHNGSGGVALELPSVSQKEYHSVPATPDVVWPDQSDQVGHSEQNESNLLAVSSETNQSIAAEDVSEKTNVFPKISRDVDGRVPHFYVAKLEISADLARPELYNQCASLVEPEHDRTINDEDASLPINTKVETGVRVKISSNPRNSSPFATINDSVFQRALSLYKRQKEETRAVYPSSRDAMSIQEEKVVLNTTKEEKPMEAIPTCDVEAVPGAEPVETEMPAPLEELEASLEKSEPVPADIPVEPNATIEVKLEVGPVSMSQVTSVDAAAEEQTSASVNLSPSDTEEHKKLVDPVCGSLHFSNVPSSEACEGEMPESVDPSGLVNLSRIHQSQSTH